MATATVQDKLIEKWFKDDTYDVLDKDISKKEYDNKLIAWLDVLGMSKKIMESGKSDSGAEDIIKNIEKLRNCVENSCNFLIRQDKLDYIQLNDGFVIVSELDCIDDLCKILCEIQWKVLLEIKMSIRGALTAGQVITNNDPKVIIGPGFINAYNLEDENAIFPRVLFSDNIYKYIEKKNIKFSYITKDVDNLKYLDFFKYELELEDDFKNFDYKLKVHGIKEYVNENYNLHINSNTNIAQKYGWIISKLSILKININR